MNPLRCVVLAGLLSASALATLTLHSAREERTGPMRTEGFPTLLGEWRGIDLPVSDRQYGLLESRDVLLREFRQRGTGPAVLACVAVAGGNRKVAHPPEVCYRGQGFEIHDLREVTFRHGDEEWAVQRLRISYRGEPELVLSWYRVGDRTTASYLYQQWLGLVAEFGHPDRLSALVRISVPIEGDESAAEQRIAGFCSEFLPALEKHVFGDKMDPGS